MDEQQVSKGEIAEALNAEPTTHRQEPAPGLVEVPPLEEVEEAIDGAQPEQREMTDDEKLLAQFYASCPPQQPVPTAIMVRSEVHGGGRCPCHPQSPEAQGFALMVFGTPTGLTYAFIPSESCSAIADELREQGAKAGREATIAVPRVATEAMPDVPGASGATLIG